MFEKIKGKFKKKEEIFFPHEFGLIRLNGVAKLEGIDDDFNKDVAFYRDGEIIKTYPYTKELVERLRDEGIPVENEQYEEEEFEFDTVSSFGSISVEKNKKWINQFIKI